jgi:Putative bacterial sensory transduction regulator
VQGKDARLAGAARYTPNGRFRPQQDAVHLHGDQQGDGNMRLRYLVAMGALAFGGAAQAEAVSATNPQSIVNAMQSAGYKATLGKDNTGDPMIDSSSGGSKFTLFFFGCTKNVDCRTVQFFAGYTDRKPTLSMMNDWNAKKRFARGYIADSGAARIEMDLDLDDGGMSTKLFEDNLEFWVTVMAAFEKHIAT